MTDKEKILLGVTAILAYLLYRKSKEKHVCPSCSCPSQPTVYFPPIIQPIQPAPIKDPSNILQEAVVYNGPAKFIVPNKTDANKGFTYFVNDSKYFKMEYITGDLSGQFSPIEVSVSEMISAWNSVKPV
jgi:hypothetical protein